MVSRASQTKKIKTIFHLYFCSYLNYAFVAGQKGRSRSSHCQAKGQEEGLKLRNTKENKFIFSLNIYVFVLEMVQGQDGREVEQRHYVGPGHVR
jgi:hypothetical protein